MKVSSSLRRYIAEQLYLYLCGSECHYESRTLQDSFAMHSPVNNKTCPLPTNSSQNAKVLGRMTLTSSKIFYHGFLVILALNFISLPNAVVVSSQNIFEEIPGLCPEPVMCQCGFDSEGRLEVACTEGGMFIIPNNSTNSPVQIIRIVSPPGKINSLTIGIFFRRFTKLEELHVVRSQIPSIGKHPFLGLNSLRVLNLASNNISTILDQNFAGLFSLEFLNLSSNAIESLEPTSFHSLPALKSLDLSKNRISKLVLVEPLFYNLTMLEALDLSENPVRELHPDVFGYLWGLKELKCRRCGIKTINPLLYALLPDIKILNLGENEFKYLNREEFFNLIHLEELYLDGNQISTLWDETFHSVHLRVLTLASNRIARLQPRAFLNSTIAELNLSNNKFENLEVETFTNIIDNSLRKLDLSHNPRLKLSSVLRILKESHQLKQLSLANNSYKDDDLPLEVFESQGQLEFLNLSGNGLTEIFPQQLSYFLSLRVLDLSKNRLKCLKADVLDRLGEIPLEQLYLSGNPWTCDGCHIPPLLQRVQDEKLELCPVEENKPALISVDGQHRDLGLFLDAVSGLAEAALASFSILYFSKLRE